ncbi:MAG: hypothetical protein ACFWUC_03310 [Oscillospiraceae bacterium]
MQLGKEKVLRPKKRRRRLLLWRTSMFLCAVILLIVAVEDTSAVMKDLSSAASFTVPVSSARPISSGPPSVSSQVSISSEPRTASAPGNAPSSESGLSVSSTKSEDWFADALFIGDSRTEGLRNYGGLEGATYYALKGLTVNTVYTRREILENGSKMTVMQAQASHSFGKIYIMLGINELGWSSTQTFIDNYTKMVRDIKQAHPNAKIYLQAIFPVSAKKSAESSIYKNDKIVSYNHIIKTIAETENVTFLDTTQAVSINGALPDDASTDGVHLNYKYCAKWCEYLKTHIK